MKKLFKSAFAVTLALVMALAAIPVAAAPTLDATTTTREAAPAWVVPDGYNAHDYTKCVEFLEQADGNGVKNGAKLSASYDPNDPESWGVDGWGERSFQWVSDSGEYRLNIVHVALKGLVGTLDVSNCTLLDSVVCFDNALTAVDVSGCDALTELYCRGNNIYSLDISGNIALEVLSCGENALSELDVSNNTALWYIYCFSNALSELDVSNNTALMHMNCSSNALSELDVSHNPLLQIFYCDNNALSELDVSANPRLFSLYCNDNELRSLDVSNHTEMTILECYGNGMRELNVSGCTALNDMHCGINELTSLDISTCSSLEYLDCSINSLTSLDLSQSGALLKLSCITNPMRSLDLSSCPNLSLDSVSADGNGYIGYYCENDYHTGERLLYVFAAPAEGDEFEAFYDQNGTLISNGAWYPHFSSYYYYWSVIPPELTRVTARFSGSGLPGDVNGSGSITIEDALLVLRYSLGLIGADALNTANADMDSDGSIAAADALLILRAALNLG